MKVSHGLRLQYVKRVLRSWGYSRNMEIYQKWTLSSMNNGEGSSVYGLPLISMRILNKHTLSCTSFFTKIPGSKTIFLMGTLFHSYTINYACTFLLADIQPLYYLSGTMHLNLIYSSPRAKFFMDIGHLGYPHERLLWLAQNPNAKIQNY